MKCPRCGQEQLDGSEECGGCHVIFSKLKSAPGAPLPANEPLMQAVGGELAAPPPTHAERAIDFFRAQKRRLLAAAVAFSFLLIGGIIYRSFRGRPVPAGAVHLQEQRFAFVPPAGWKPVKSERKSVLPSGEPAPGSFADWPQGFPEPRAHFEYRADEQMILDQEITVPAIFVSAFGQELPRLSEGNQAKFVELVHAEVSKRLPGFRARDVAAVEVDGRPAVRMEGTVPVYLRVVPALYRDPKYLGKTRMRQQAREQRHDWINMKVVYIYVSGKRSALAAGYTALAAADPRFQRAFDDLVASLRILYGGFSRSRAEGR